MMQSLKKFVFAVSVSLALATNGVANTQGLWQDKKQPEPVKERPKPDSKGGDNNKDRKNDEKKNDDRRGGDKKKP